MKTTVKVTCTNGNHWTTGINLDLAGARDYFMGQRFTREDQFTGAEVVDVVCSVDEVQS